MRCIFTSLSATWPVVSFPAALAVLFCLALTVPCQSWAQDPPLKALIVDGQNNHSNWPETTVMMKKYLEQTGLFSVDISRTAAEGTDENFAPEFSNYQVVVSNYNGAAWPESAKSAFESYVAEGGGFVVVHAADNAFPDWKEYNRMIGLGGWGGRNQTSGPMVYFDEESGKMVRDESDGSGGSHGSQHPFLVVTREPDHPITRGLPKAWMHANDELYDRLRGPAENMKVLATAWSSKETSGSGKHEPMLITIEYKKGRVFHVPMGHGNDSMECAGFITVLQRGAEWAATGEVTIPVPDDFPGMDATSSRKFDFPPQDN
jgi:uncharacterized protein